jgi:hypothetical protein
MNTFTKLNVVSHNNEFVRSQCQSTSPHLPESTSQINRRDSRQWIVLTFVSSAGKALKALKASPMAMFCCQFICVHPVELSGSMRSATPLCGLTVRFSKSRVHNFLNAEEYDFFRNIVALICSLVTLPNASSKSSLIEELWNWSHSKRKLAPTQLFGGDRKVHVRTSDLRVSLKYDM